eukprot:CAMPEP_0177328954 /NCGR_PEP_ID=MMETSP0368-20130122/19712_1 /TAXON_ID=447022 ORGANISM="Scrippsiella hangoei-like, Strain SHHI-4" /NCGR_SAMPLE_ID=MMETSP0368 /ASSEMBLY_ACC=CAM_ASM_000363 /LENGTH=411 /DNA_ID=CAMNT_0018789143 /DNA_START=20 /DNA_END=1253 /DNA_ORIENTATION=+
MVKKLRAVEAEKEPKAEDKKKKLKTAEAGAGKKGAAAAEAGAGTGAGAGAAGGAGGDDEGKHKKRPGQKRTSKMKREAKLRAQNGEVGQTAVPARQGGDGGKGKGKSEGKGKGDGKGKGEGKGKGDGKGGKTVTKKAQPEEDPEEDKYLECRIYVKGLAEGCDETIIRKLFQKHGKIRSVSLLMSTRKVFRGAAFVTFEDQKTCKKALNEDGIMFHGKELSVKTAAPPLPKGPKGPNLQVYLGGLPFIAEAKILKKDFGECGEMSKFRMLMNDKTGKFRGVAFVTYKDQAGVNKALKYNDTEYGGRKISVKLADPKGTLRRDDDDDDEDAAGDDEDVAAVETSGGKKRAREGGAEEGGKPKKGKKAAGGGAQKEGAGDDAGEAVAEAEGAKKGAGANGKAMKKKGAKKMLE